MKRRLLYLILMLSITVTACGAPAQLQTTDEFVIENRVNFYDTGKEIVKEEKPTTVEVVSIEDIDDTQKELEVSKDSETFTHPEFKMEDMISSKEIDLRTEPTVDLSKISKYTLTPEDLDVRVYNRLITITGTTLGEFLDTFENNVWIMEERMNTSDSLYPYQTMSYNFRMPDSFDNGIILTVVNTTDSPVVIRDLPICSVQVDYVEGQDIKTEINIKEEVSGISDGYFIDIYEDTQYDLFIARIIPTQRLALEYIKTLTNSEAITDGKQDLSFGSNYIQIAGKSVDFNKAKLVDYITAFDARLDLELPSYMTSVFYCDGEWLDSKEPFWVYGNGFVTLNVWDAPNSKGSKNESRDMIFINTIYGEAETSKTNLWLFPIDSVFTRFDGYTEYSNEVFNIGGLTNKIVGDEVLDWYDTTANIRVNDLTKDELLNSNGLVSLFAQGIEDNEYLQYRPNNTGFHLSYNITPIIKDNVNKGFNIAINKNDLEPFIPNN